jgi:hypothetical protein
MTGARVERRLAAILAADVSNVDIPKAKRIEFRIGIHVGDIIIDDNDIFGDGVNIAARLEGIADPGGICISDDAHRQIRGKTVVEDIITALSRMTWLFVVARNSSFTYKGKAVDIKQVGRELGVRYVPEGSVRKAGNRVRITGQLIDAATGARPWRACARSTRTSGCRISKGYGRRAGLRI